ncbi:MAG: GNAT family N-acetyltransferase [Chloroflexota bacterium]|nr:GNAT family N-acetyltransferase [Chloroflexota bacterium]
MSDVNYTIRTYRHSDFTSYVQLHIDAERADKAGCYTSPRSLNEKLDRPGFHPENNLFVAETEGAIAGSLDIVVELGIGRVVANCLVHPQHRRRGLATRLLREAEQRASEMEARVVQGSIAEGNVAAKNLLSGLSFNYVHRFLELSLDISEAHWVAATQVSYRCRHLQRGEEPSLAEIQNRCFMDTWGYHPNTVEEITYRVGMSDCCHEGIFMVCESEQPVGYCWTIVGAGENVAPGARKGRIHMLAVAREYRGKGLGKSVLQAGLSYLASREIGTVELSVDAGNREAMALYESFGFRVQSATDWYEKALV